MKEAWDYIRSIEFCRTSISQTPFNLNDKQYLEYENSNMNSFRTFYDFSRNRTFDLRT